MSRGKTPSCPEPLPRAWTFEAGLTVRFVQPRFTRVHSSEAVWESQRRATDVHGWSWSSVYKDQKHCVYALERVTAAGYRDDTSEPEETRELLALFGLAPTALSLRGMATTRLDYFQIAPSRRGGTFGVLAFAAFARFTADLGRTELILPALNEANVLNWYAKLGGSRGFDGWRPARNLIAIHFSSATLNGLAERADGLEDEKEDA